MTRTNTPTPTRTRTATGTRTGTRTVTATVSRTPTPSVTPLPVGPKITAFGVARADGRPINTIGIEDHGYLTYVRPPSGFLIYLEAMPGPNRLPVGTVTFNSNLNNPTVLPHLQMVVSRPLGNGSSAVCDDGPAPSLVGGIPAVVPPAFGGSQVVSNAINDLGCRFDARNAMTPCTRDPFTQVESFTAAGTTVQFCTTPGVGVEMAFPVGDTILTARVLDTANQPGPPHSIVVRVLGE